MSTYPLRLNHVGEGVRGLLKDSTKRRGGIDASAMALSPTLNASGPVIVCTTRLMTMEDMDAASRRSPTSRPPWE